MQDYASDFEERVGKHYYNSHPSEFRADHAKWLTVMGVPVQYVDKVADYAWQEGHAYGFAEVFNHSLDLIEIFA